MFDYEVVVIESYIDNMLNEQASSYMGKIWNFKKDMYSSAHGELSNIIDIDDFYCTHVVFINKVTREVLMTFKYIDYDACSKASVDFPLIKHAAYQSDVLYNSVCEYISKIKRSGGRISYSGGWCMDNKVKSPKMRLMLIQAYVCIHYLEQVNKNYSFITGIGVKEVGTINFFNRNFHTVPIVNELVELSGVGSIHGCFLSASIEQLSICGTKNMHKYKPVWDSRTIIG
ncbi:TPA: hypothetical protein I7241_19285 [Vibrio vulnificus]|nr:hypothetical protein [Vibrio vulnificus]